MILIIDNYDSFTYNLYQLVAQQEKHILVVRNDKISLQEIETMAPKAIILSPGPGNPSQAGICLPLIRRFSPSIPILGVCLGHQAIAEAFGGDIVQAPEIVHGKISYIYHSGAELFANLPQPFTAGRYHSLMVSKESLPAEFSIEAESADGIIMAIKHRQYSCYGVQFHPESILTPDGEIVIQQFLKKVKTC